MCVAGEKVEVFFFPPKNYEMRLGRCVVLRPEPMMLRVAEQYVVFVELNRGLTL